MSQKKYFANLQAPTADLCVRMANLKTWFFVSKCQCVFVELLGLKKKRCSTLLNSYVVERYSSAMTSVYVEKCLCQNRFAQRRCKDRRGSPHSESCCRKQRREKYLVSKDNRAKLSQTKTTNCIEHCLYFFFPPAVNRLDQQESVHFSRLSGAL